MNWSITMKLLILGLIVSSAMGVRASGAQAAGTQPRELTAPKVTCLMLAGGKKGDMMPGRTGERFGVISNPGSNTRQNTKGVITTEVMPSLDRKGRPGAEIWQLRDEAWHFIHADRSSLPGVDGATATFSLVSVSEATTSFLNPSLGGGGKQYIDCFEGGHGPGVVLRRNLQGAGVTRFTDEALWYLDSDGIAKLVARTGKQCPDSPQGHQFLQLTVPERPVTDGLGRVAFCAKVAVGGDQGNWRMGLWGGDAGEPKRLAYFGEPSPIDGTVIGGVSQLTMDRQGRLFFFDPTPFFDGRQNYGISAVWMFDGQHFTKRIAPGMTTLEGHKIRTLSGPQHRMANLLGCTLITGETVTSKSFPLAVFLVDDEGIHTVMRNGDRPPGFGPNYYFDLTVSSSGPLVALSADGSVGAIRVAVKEVGRRPGKSIETLWRVRKDGIELVATIDKQLGTLSTHRITAFDAALDVSGTGEILFAARLESTDLGAKDRQISGLWSGSPDRVRLVTTFPMTVDLGPKGTRVLQNFIPIGGAAYDSEGRVYGVGRFRDDTSAILRFELDR